MNDTLPAAQIAVAFIEFAMSELNRLHDDAVTIRRHIAELNGQLGALRGLLIEARKVLSTLEPEDTPEAELLAQLLHDIDAAASQEPKHV